MPINTPYFYTSLLNTADIPPPLTSLPGGGSSILKRGPAPGTITPLPYTASRMGTDGVGRALIGHLPG